MTRAEFESWLTQNGYKPDAYGHYQRVSGTETYRYKLSTVMARKEVKARIDDHNEWIRVMSGYYSKLSIGLDGRLRGMTR